MLNTHTDSRAQATDIGILFVHGVGEQRQFQALQGLAKSLMKALDNQRTRNFKINLQINQLSSGPLGAEQQTWDDSSQAPIIIHLKDNLSQDTRIHLREVWWADIDPPNAPEKVLQFWCWGLSLWNARGFFKTPILSDYENDLMQLKKTNHNESERGKVSPLDRLLYFVIGIVFFLVQPILSFFNVIFNIFGIPFVSVTAISQFASKIKLYQMNGGKGKGTLRDFGNPPRFSIRRRMINAMIPMATSGYDRWYIMAHSLGAVVAFNSLSEPELNLANYLDEKMWIRACGSRLNQPDTLQASLISVRGNMRPSRPFWLGENDRIYRHKLFKNLQGLVTYGAPLDIFSDLWPAMMLGNKKKGAFNLSFKWFNIHDPSDPIATEAEPLFQDLDDYHGIKPIDIAYKADGLHLQSHISYLNVDPESPKSNDALIDRILDWVMYKKCPDKSRQLEPSKKWLKKGQFGTRVHGLLSYLLWFIGSYLAALILTGILGLLAIIIDFDLFYIFLKSLNLCNSWISWKWLCNPFLFYPLCLLMSAFIIVFIAGEISRMFIFDLKERILSFLEDRANKRFTVDDIQSEFGESIEVNRKALDDLTKENKIRKDKDIDNNYFKYFYTSYSFILSDGFRNKVTAYDVYIRLKLMDEITEKLSFNPDTEREDRIRGSSFHHKGQKSQMWFLRISPDLVDLHLVLYYITDSSTPLRDPIISLMDLT